VNPARDVLRLHGIEAMTDPDPGGRAPNERRLFPLGLPLGLSAVDEGSEVRPLVRPRLHLLDEQRRKLLGDVAVAREDLPQSPRDFPVRFEIARRLRPCFFSSI
jgi:hypothetical protein